MIRAYIHDRLVSMNVAVSLVRIPQDESVWDGHAQILRLGTDLLATGWEPIGDPAAEIKPTFTLGREEARALLDALAEHYQGASDMRMLRADRDHERGRVDKLLDVVAEIAKGRA